MRKIVTKMQDAASVRIPVPWERLCISEQPDSYISILINITQVLILVTIAAQQPASG